MRRRPSITPLVCPICLTMYSGLVRPGSRCNDLSQGQRRRCVGRVIPEAEFIRAEWLTQNPAYDRLGLDTDLKAVRAQLIDFMSRLRLLEERVEGKLQGLSHSPSVPSPIH